MFVVIEGEATFETLAARSGAERASGGTASEDGEIAVGTDEAVRFAPGEFQSGRNDTDGVTVVLAIGAPRDTEDVRVPLECPECDDDHMRLDAGETGTTFVCPRCDAERVPSECPECGGEMRFASSEGDRVVVCSDCGAESERPPFRDAG